MSVSLPNDNRTLLLVDDDVLFRTRLKRAFAERGFNVRDAGTCADALDAARQESPELALVDLRLPGESGLELVQQLRAIDPATSVVVLTGYGSIATALESVRRGAAGYLTKPVDADQIVAAFDGQAAADARPSLSPQPLARVEWEHIQRVLAHCQGNVTQAARILGLHRRSLQRKLAKYPVAESHE